MPLDLAAAQVPEPLDLRLDVVGLDVEVDPRHVVAGRLDHELHARRGLAEDDVLRVLVVGFAVLARAADQKVTALSCSPWGRRRGRRSGGAMRHGHVPWHA